MSANETTSAGGRGEPPTTEKAMTSKSRGRVRTSMVLAEYDGGGYTTRDTRYFPRVVRFR